MTDKDIEHLKQCNDGTPQYDQRVQDSYRKLQFRLSIYDQVPQQGRGIRLGIYQVEADCGAGAGEKNMQRLEVAVNQAKFKDISGDKFEQDGDYFSGNFSCPDNKESKTD